MSEIQISITAQEANYILRSIEHISRLGVSNDIARSISQKIIQKLDK